MDGSKVDLDGFLFELQDLGVEVKVAWDAPALNEIRIVVTTRTAKEDLLKFRHAIINFIATAEDTMLLGGPEDE